MFKKHLYAFLMAKARRGASSGMKFEVQYDLAFSRFRAADRLHHGGKIGVHDEDQELYEETSEPMSYQPDIDGEDEDAPPEEPKSRRKTDG